LLLFSLSVASSAQVRRDYDRRDQGSWQQLGRSYVDGRNDHDTIVVNSSERFTSLQLEVNGGTIQFQRVVVHFDNGGDHRLDIRDRIVSGSRTREIDLPGDRRRIRSVEFWYSRGDWRSRPYVTLYGRGDFDVPSRDNRDDRDRGGYEGRWESLGQRSVDGRNDHDRIFVNSNQSFRSLQLEVTGGSIEFRRVVVHYDNGADQTLDIRERISSGQRTREIDLPGDRRRIRSVEFWYANAGWRSRPSVNLYGRSGFGGSSFPGGPDDPRWENLGQAYVDARNDHDRINVNTGETFRALQLGVKGGAIEFQRVVVHFENGQDSEIAVSQRIEQGDRTRVIDLPGNRRRIQSIEFWYSKERWSDRPLVNVWGLRSGF
jgi:hypothetical protein